MPIANNATSRAGSAVGLMQRLARRFEEPSSCVRQAAGTDVQRVVVSITRHVHQINRGSSSIDRSVTGRTLPAATAVSQA